MNRLVARSTHVHPQMSANILNHVRTLPFLLEAKFQTVVQEEQRQHLQQQQVESSSSPSNVQAMIAENPNEEAKLPACFSDYSESQKSNTSSENDFDLSKFLFQVNPARLLFFHPLQAVRISK